MDCEIDLTKNDKKIIVAYGVLALHNLMCSANKEDKLMDIRLKDFGAEILDTCNTRTLKDALNLCQKFIKEDAEEKQTNI